MTQQSHTPLHSGYTIDQIDEDTVFIMPDPLNFGENDRSRPIAKMIGEDKEANAAFIVTACNSHYTLTEQRDELLAALKEAADNYVAVVCNTQDKAPDEVKIDHVVARWYNAIAKVG